MIIDLLEQRKQLAEQLDRARQCLEQAQTVISDITHGLAELDEVITEQVIEAHDWDPEARE